MYSNVRFGTIGGRFSSCRTEGTAFRFATHNLWNSERPRCSAIEGVGSCWFRDATSRVVDGSAAEHSQLKKESIFTLLWSDATCQLDSSAADQRDARCRAIPEQASDDYHCSIHHDATVSADQTNDLSPFSPCPPRMETFNRSHSDTECV